MRTEADLADSTTNGQAHSDGRSKPPGLLMRIRLKLGGGRGGVSGNGWYPGANQRPVYGKTNGGWHNLVGVALHVNVSNGNLYNWVASPSVEMSCHFEVYKVGPPEQYLPITETSWCQTDGNGYYISIETEGYPTEPLNANQLEHIAGIMAWAHQNAGVPLVISDAPNNPGFIWHGAGGEAWGGHVGCPGDLRKAQRPGILARASQILSPTPVPAPAPKPIPKPVPPIPKAWSDMATEAEVFSATSPFPHRYIRFINSGPHNNEDAVYEVLPSGYLLHIDKFNYVTVYGSPPATSVDLRWVYWKLPILPGSPDYRNVTPSVPPVKA